MNPTYQLLLDCFNRVASDPGTIPQVPLGHFPDDSDERQLFDAFQTMLERVGESRQQLREQYEELVNSIDGIVWEADAQTVEFSFVSQQAERLLGYPATRWVDEPTFWQDHMHPEDRDWAVPFCAIATEEMRPHQFEYRMFADDGRTVWLRDIVSVGIENNQPVRLRGVMIDITEQKQAQEAIEQLRRQNELILNSAGEGIYGIDRDGRTTFVNPAAARMLGWDQEELIGRHLHDLVHHTKPDGSPYPREECPILDTIKDGISRSVDTERFWRKDGTSLPVEYIGTPIREAGEVVGAVITFQDITERVRAQNALRESEARLRLVTDQMPAILWTTDYHLLITSMRGAGLAALGLGHDSLVGTTLFDFFGSTDPDHPELAPYLAARRGDSVSYETDIGGRTLGAHLEPLRDAAGAIVGTIGIALDISERKQAEVRLREKEEQYRSIFEATSDGLMIRNLNGNIVEVNPAYGAMHGYTRDELIGQPLTTLIHPDYHYVLKESVEAISARGDDYRIEAVNMRKDGTPLFVEVRGTSFTYKGEPHVLAIVRDITERRQAEEQLREKEEQYRSVFESTTDGLVINDRETGAAVAVNPAFARMHGYTVEECVNLPPTALIPPSHHHLFWDYLETVRAGEEFRAEGFGLRKDGTLVPMEIHGTGLTYLGKPHILSVVRDITERKRAEAQLREKEAQYRSIFEATGDGLIIRNLDGIIVEANPAYCRMHGYTQDEMVGRHITEFLASDASPNLGAAGAISTTGDTFHKLRKDGTLLYVEARGTAFTYKGQPHILAVVRDITERKQAEEQIREKEEQYRSIFESTSDGLIINDSRTGAVVAVNPAFARMHGYNVEELAGRQHLPLHPPDSQHLFLEYLETVRAGREFRAEGVHLRKDGSPFPVEIHGTGFTYMGTRHSLGVVRDITERKRAEAQLREKEEQYRSIFEATMDGLVITDLGTGRLIAVNPAFAQMHGYTIEELLKLHPTQFIHPDDHSKFFKYIEMVGAGETFRTEAMDVRKDGTLFPVEVHGSSYAYGGERHVLGVVRDITERVKAYELLEQRVQERTQELSTLLEVSQNVASTLELKPLLDLILDQLRAVADYNRASLAILDGEEMVIAAYQGRFAAQEVIGERFSVEKLGLIWDRFQAREYVLIDDIHGDSPPARVVQDYIGSDNVQRIQDVCSSILVPLVSRERVIGYLNVAHRQTGYYTDHQARLVLAIANQVAGAIENARLYEEAQEETRKAAALAQVASSVALGGTLETALDEVARTVVEASGAVACSMIIAEGEPTRIGIFGAYGMPDGYAAGLEAIVRNGNKIMTVERYYEPEPLVVHGLRQAVLAQPTHAPIHRFMSQVAWDTMVSLPIVYQERHLGRLNLYYPPNKEPDQEELAFLSAIVSQAATAIENARLYAQAQTAAATQERQRLARELHDSVSQALYGIGLGTYAAKNLFERNQSGVAEALDYVTSLAAAGLAEMRALIFELRPESLEIEGLVAALGKQASALAARHRIEVETELPGEPDLPIEVKEVLYRVAQEAMHNTVKHAEAQRVHLRLDYSDSAVVLDLSDDGKGFDPNGSFPGHLGLHSMRERVTQLGGTFEIESAPGVGTAIHIHIPI